MTWLNACSLAILSQVGDVAVNSVLPRFVAQVSTLQQLTMNHMKIVPEGLKISPAQNSYFTSSLNTCHWKQQVPHVLLWILLKW